MGARAPESPVVRHYPVGLENQALGAPADPGCGRLEGDSGGGLAMWRACPHALDDLSVLPSSTRMPRAPASPAPLPYWLLAPSALRRPSVLVDPRRRPPPAPDALQDHQPRAGRDVPSLVSRFRDQRELGGDHARDGRGGVGLAVEEVRDSRHGGELEALVGVELELHRVTTLASDWSLTRHGPAGAACRRRPSARSTRSTVASSGLPPGDSAL